MKHQGTDVLAGGENCLTRRHWEWVRVTCSLCFLAVLGRGGAWYPKAILLTIFMTDSQGAVNYCKRRACMRAGGYAPTLRPKRQRAGPPVLSTDSDDDDPSDDATKIGELFGIHGFR